MEMSSLTVNTGKCTHGIFSPAAAMAFHFRCPTCGGRMARCEFGFYVPTGQFIFGGVSKDHLRSLIGIFQKDRLAWWCYDKGIFEVWIHGMNIAEMRELLDAHPASCEWFVTLNEKA